MFDSLELMGVRLQPFLILSDDVFTLLNIPWVSSLILYRVPNKNSF